VGVGVGVGGVGVGAPFKKRIQNPRRREIYSIMLGRELTDSEEQIYAEIEDRHIEEDRQRIEEDAAEEESISPRVLFPSSPLSSTRAGVARRLEFYSSGDWSPIPLMTSSSASSSVASVASVASWEAALPIIVTKKPEEESVGECSVCYASLPARSNHVFTKCGHLFCVKCLLVWWDTTSTCAMCRAELLDAQAVPAPVIVDVLSSDDGGNGGDDDIQRWLELERDGYGHGVYFNAALGMAAAAARARDDDFVGGGGVNHLPARPIPIIDQYLYTDDGIHWSSPITNPERDDDDDEVQLTLNERWNIRLNREIASTLWARLRFREMLFTDVDFLGETFHTFVARRNWIGLGHLDMGNHLMYEFVMNRTCAYNAPVETNFFGYISSIVVVEIDNPTPAPPANVGEEEYSWWENNHEYAFVVRVFSPSASAPYGMYNVDEGTFEPAELMFRFSDIRRMYLIQAMERGAI
jgi:hypothetical protein